MSSDDRAQVRPRFPSHDEMHTRLQNARLLIVRLLAPANPAHTVVAMACAFHHACAIFFQLLSSFPIPFECILAPLVLAALALHRYFLLKPKLRLPPSPPSLPIFGNWLQVGNGLNHHNLSRMAKTYGPVFHLKMGRRDVVVVSSPHLAREVLHTQDVEFGSRSRNVVFDLFTGNGQDMVFTVYGSHWRKMRRIMTIPFFTNKVVQRSTPCWREEIDSAIADLKANPSSATTGIVVRHRLQLLVYNDLYRIAFNRRFETEDDHLYLELKRLNGDRSRLAQSLDYNYGDFIPVLRPFLRSYLQLCQKVKDERLALFKKHFVDEHRRRTSMEAPSNDEKCAIDHILDAQEKGEITEENVLYIIENLNVAAIETTLWSIEWVLAELVNNPHIQKRLRDELNTELGYGVPLTEAELPKLPYLLAVVKESLRLHMAIPLLVPRLNPQQAKLGGYDIPAGSKIMVNAWYLANNPEWWEKPNVFNPDRFLGPEKKVDASGNDCRFLPFGVGRRRCPGIILVMPMVSLLLGRLVQVFELLPPPGQSKLDLTGKGGQFSWKIANHSVVVCKPL